MKFDVTKEGHTLKIKPNIERIGNDVIIHIPSLEIIKALKPLTEAKVKE